MSATRTMWLRVLGRMVCYSHVEGPRGLARFVMHGIKHDVFSSVGVSR